ncbi:hypothetical protein B0T24DRAFT_690233 [Lasiosphaeria ovina]|uniref:Uncharacterized protein n=1 Tax=Lasiosphaeria ovina TaxID=92902 RepID=A0AAE0JU04_9PEZI|nr:hypothetical protein B0T24DRAFT_690233 [Lasiosphaeria ovina]
MGQILSLLACGGHDKHYGGTREDRTRRRIDRINRDRQEQRAMRRQRREAGEELPEARRARNRQERADKRKARQSAAAAEGHSSKRSGEHRSRRYSHHVSWHPGDQTGEQSSSTGDESQMLLHQNPPPRDLTNAAAANPLVGLRFLLEHGASAEGPGFEARLDRKVKHLTVRPWDSVPKPVSCLELLVEKPPSSHLPVDRARCPWQQVFAGLVLPAVTTDEASSTLSQYLVRLGKHSAVDLGNPDSHAVCVIDGLLKNRGADLNAVFPHDRYVRVNSSQTPAPALHHLCGDLNNWEWLQTVEAHITAKECRRGELRKHLLPFLLARGADPDVVVEGKRAVDVLLGGAKRYDQGAQERLSKYAVLLRASESGGETKTLVVCQSRRD